MENQQMAMPAEMPAAGPGPDQMAIYEQMRQQISPQEFTNEMLAGASQVDPQAVAEFTEELRDLDVSAEELDALNDLVDEILANPERYEEIRQKYLAQGLPEDILPEQFDPNFFAAMNMAVDQMIAAPTGVQAFAKGGIAELKPIAKAIASYGRNGDTMLAHITPAEARMLRRQGGSGTINPVTGLPEFFLKKAFKKIGKAVKKFAQSSIGRIVLPIALGFFLGPAAAGFLGVSSVAGVAAVSGFVGSAGSTLLAGGNLKDALKAGAIGGVTAGAGAGVMGGADAFAAGSYTGPTTVGGQFDKFKSAISPTAPTPGLDAAGQAPVPTDTGVTVSPIPDSGPNLSQTGTGILDTPPAALSQADPLGNFIQQNDALRAGANTGGQTAGNVLTDNVTTGAQRDAFIAEQGLDKPSMVDSTKKFISEKISPSGIRAAGQQEAMSKTLAEFPGRTAYDVATAAPGTALAKAYAANSPGIFSTYGPMAAVGLGTMAAFGGFDSKPVEGGDITKSLMKPVTQRIREGGTQRQMYLQNLPGVVYDEFGEPIAGQNTRFPTYDVPDYDFGGFGSPTGQSQNQGIMNLPSVYTPPPGTIGSRRVEQPYNNSDMYSNLMAPRRYNDGGEVQNNKTRENFDYKAYLAAVPGIQRELDAGVANFGTINDVPAAAYNHYLRYGIAEGQQFPFLSNTNSSSGTPTQVSLAAMETPPEVLANQQRENRRKADLKRAERLAGGSGQMYNNINAGLAALAPEQFPGGPVQLDPAREQAIRDAFSQARPASDIDYAKVMQQQGFRPEEVAAFSGSSFGDINRRFRTAMRQDASFPMLSGQRDAMYNQNQILANARGINAPVAQQQPAAQPTPGMSYTQDQMPSGGGTSIQGGFDEYGKLYGSEPYHYGRGPKPGSSTTAQTPAANPYSNITNPQAGYTGPNILSQALAGGLQRTPEGQMQSYARLMQQGATDPQIRNAVETMFGPQSNTDYNYLTSGAQRFMNQGGIAALAKGGYPRRTGQISGPGTEKSDDIPAMLSDGEFVMTAAAVRGAGKGSRRAGAKQMYKLMHQLEKNSERG